MAKVKTQPDTEISALQEIVNAPEEVRAFGRTYLIQKFTFGPMCQALEYIGPMGFLLAQLSAFPVDKKGKLKMSKDDAIRFSAQAISTCGPSVFGLVSIATQEPAEWLEQQDPLEGMEIFIKVLEKNAGFFTRENLDRLTAMVSGLTQAIPKLGGGTSAT